MSETVYDELVEAAKTRPDYQPQQENQSDENYLIHLLLCVGATPDNVFIRLSKEALDWYNTVGKMINNKVPSSQWPHCPGFKDPTPDPLPKVTSISKRPKDKKSQLVATVRAMLMMKPELSAREVWQHLTKTDFPNANFSVVSVICSETRSFIHLAKEYGFWRDKSIFEDTPQGESTVVEAPTPEVQQETE